LAEIVVFLRQYGARRQFFPAYRVEDFSSGRLRGLAAEDVLVARRDGQIAGTLAVWDQAGYKQDIVDAYGPGLARLRPLYDLAARLLGARPLTPPGQALPLAFASHICVAQDDARVLRTLLAAAMAKAYARGKSFLMLGLADNDPLLATARRPLHIRYHSELFAAGWDAAALASLDERVPYIEIATL
jgi:hypothetical protein